VISDRAAAGNSRPPRTGLGAPVGVEPGEKDDPVAGSRPAEAEGATGMAAVVAVGRLLGVEVGVLVDSALAPALRPPQHGLTPGKALRDRHQLEGAVRMQAGANSGRGVGADVGQEDGHPTMLDGTLPASDLLAGQAAMLRPRLWLPALLGAGR